MGKFIYRGANQKRVFAWPIVELPHVQVSGGWGMEEREEMLCLYGRAELEFWFVEILLI